MESGERVICLDNSYTGREENLNKWWNNSSFEFLRHDVVEPIKLEVDKIWHLACPASPVHYQNNPIKTAKTSFLGTLNMLGLAKRVKAKILIASTSEIYGDPKVHPQPEDYTGSVNTIGIRSCYDEGKRIAETLCYDYERIHKVQVRVARIFNTYGPRMSIQDGRVVSNFIVQALENRPITIYGDGQQTRSFCFVDDLINGLLKLMACNYTKPINLGNPTEFTILELANLIKEKIESNSDIIFKPLPEDDPLQRRPMINLAKKELNWEPLINISKGLDLTIDYFKEEIKKI
tara:strand:- start:55 stop:927 length:873 start_codon:yes stop_codon:yes gene_type:complete